MRLNRTVRLSDSAWAGLDEVAKISNFSRADLVEWWAAMLILNKEKLKELAATENLTVEDLSNLQWEQMPNLLQQIRANRPPTGFPLRVKPKDEGQRTD